MRKILIGCCVCAAVLCGSAAWAADPNAYSTSWEGRYEADDRPDVESGFVSEAPSGDQAVITTVADGICTINTMGDETKWARWCLYPDDPFDLTSGIFDDPNLAGVTFEIRAKVIDTERVGVCVVSLTDQRTFESGGDTYVRRIATFGLEPTLINMTNLRNVPFNTKDDFHIYRVLLRDHPDPKVGQLSAVYVDNEYDPTISVKGISWQDMNEPCWFANRLLFGEHYCDQRGSNWEIDYLRWTNAGAIPPPPPPPVCGDEAHPYPSVDWSGPGGERDCVVNLYDLAYFADTWLDEATSVGGGVTADPCTWEGVYDGSVLPSASGWVAKGTAAFMSSVSSGVLKLDTYDFDWVGFWDLAVDPCFSFTRGATVEFRAKLNEWEGGASAALSLLGEGGTVSCILSGPDATYPDGRFSVTNVGGYEMDTMDDFHVYRVAAGLGPDLVKVWVDNDPTPVIEETLPGSMPPFGGLSFGDLTGVDDADWSIDYIYWTNAGAFPPAGAASYCGDAEHQPPDTEMDYICVVNLGDFAFLAQEWLADTRP